MATSITRQVVSGASYVGSYSDGIDESVTNASAPSTDAIYFQSLSSQTSVTIPANTAFIRVYGPSGGTNNLRISGATGASAAECVVLDPTRPSLLAIPSSSPRLCVGAAASTSDVCTEFF